MRTSACSRGGPRSSLSGLAASVGTEVANAVYAG